MAELLPIVVLVMAGLVMPALITIYRLRIRNGGFDVSRRPGGVTIFRTDVGEITLDGTRLIVAPRRGPRREMPLGDVVGLRYTHASRPAFDEILVDFDLWDLSARWRDQIDWYGIAIVTTGGDIPVYLAGQLDRREPFMQWWFDWTEDVLSSLHLFQHLEERTLSVLTQLRAAFRAAGREVPLV